MNKKAVLPALLVGLVISSMVINPSESINNWYLRWMWANFAGVFVGVILYRLAFQYFARSYFGAGGDRFAVLGLIMLIIPAALQFTAYPRAFLAENIGRDINLMSSFLSHDFATPIKFLLANALPGLIFALMYAVIMFVFRAEFNPPAAHRALYASLELENEQINQPSTMITVIYYGLLAGYVLYCGLSWYVVGGILLLLFFRTSPITLSSVVLILLAVAVEAINIRANVPISIALFAHPDKFLKFGTITPMNPAIVLLLVPFYVLEIAKKYSSTLTESLSRAVPNIGKSQNSAVVKANSDTGVYIGERIR